MAQTVCRIQRIPKWLRIGVAIVLLAIGIPLWITPLPGGIVLVSFASMLLFCSYPLLRTRIVNLVPKNSMIGRRFRAFLAGCEACRPNPTVIDSLKNKAKNRSVPDSYAADAPDR